MLEIPKFSVVISNYNYARFVGEAIDSALNLKCKNFEIIVVDDGSTDNSRDVIAAYGEKIRYIFQDNQGQRVACNVGFAASDGQAVIFLDADDLLLPEIADQIAAVWQSDVSKVQVLMQRVNEQGQSLHSVLPRLLTPPSANQIRRWATEFGEYPSPPGSGNVYARSYLEKIMPLSQMRDSAPDSTLIAMAPFFGDVVTILRPLVHYRFHGANDSNLLANEENFGREVGRALKRLEAAQEACNVNGMPPPPISVLRRNSHLLQLRAASLRLLPMSHPLPNDSRASVLQDSWLLLLRDSLEPLRRRIIMAVFSLMVLITPLPIARILIRIRFQPR